MSFNLVVDNLELFEELFEYIKKDGVTLSDAVREHGGTTYYIPSYKTTFRNQDIIDLYKENLGKIGVVKALAKKYDLTERQIYDITKEVREPSLI